MRERTIVLTRPIEHEGRKIRAIHMRAFTAGDHAAVSAINGTDPHFRLAQLISIATDLSLETLRKLAQCDLDALGMAMEAMVNEEMEEPDPPSLADLKTKRMN